MKTSTVDANADYDEERHDVQDSNVSEPEHDAVNEVHAACAMNTKKERKSQS